MELKNMDKNNIILNKIAAKIDSGYVYKKLKVIANDYSLNLDQLGDLNICTGMLLMGEMEPADFTKKIQEVLEIDSEKVDEIVSDISNNIVLQIKSELANPIQNIQINVPSQISDSTGKPLVGAPPMITPTTPVTVLSQKPSNYDLNPIEKVGNLTIETPVQVATQYNETNISKESILKGIEDAEVNMVDHLLSAPVSNTQTVETKKVVVEESRPPKKEYSSDPYREQI